MDASDIPYKIPAIFASSAPSGEVTSPIPLTPPGSGLVSWQRGWEIINATDPGAGGIPPWWQDFMGLFQITSAWLQWAQAGAPVGYDAAFSSDIGGYPKGALIQSATGPGLGWLSTVDDNTSDPDTGGANWRPVVFPASSGRATAGLSAVYTFAGNPNGSLPGTAATVTTPPDMCWDTTDGFMWVSLGGTVWKNIAPTFVAATLSSVSFGSSGTWTVPTGVTSVHVRMWGGGGGGGGSNTGSGFGYRGGGGGYCEGYLSVTPGANITVTVGVGGAGGTTSPTSGAAGTASAFLSMTANGGGAGTVAGGGGSGAGGTASGGTILNITGQFGAPPSLVGAQADQFPGGSTFATSSCGPGLGDFVAFNGIFPGGGATGSISATVNIAGGTGANGLVLLDWIET